MSLLLVFCGGMLGAPARYLLDRYLSRRRDSTLPWGTLTVNVTGCFLLGLLAGAAAAMPAGGGLLLGTGVCGALTTFSTFGYETARLLEDGSVLPAGLNMLASLGLGLLAAAAGYALGALA